MTTTEIVESAGPALITLIAFDETGRQVGQRSRLNVRMWPQANALGEVLSTDPNAGTPLPSSFPKIGEEVPMDDQGNMLPTEF